MSSSRTRRSSSRLVATVAVVEDDPSVRHAHARILRAAGLKVTSFSSAEELLKVYGLARPSLPGRRPGTSWNERCGAGGEASRQRTTPSDGLRDRPAERRFLAGAARAWRNTLPAEAVRTRPAPRAGEAATRRYGKPHIGQWAGALRPPPRSRSRQQNPHLVERPTRTRAAAAFTRAARPRVGLPVWGAETSATLSPHSSPGPHFPDCIRGVACSLDQGTAGRASPWPRLTARGRVRGAKALKSA